MPPTAEALTGIVSSSSSHGNGGNSKKAMKKGKSNKASSLTAPKAPQVVEQREPPPSNSSSFNPFQQYMSQIENSFGVTSIENSVVGGGEDVAQDNMEAVHAAYGNGNHKNNNYFHNSSAASIASSCADLYAIQVMQYNNDDDHDEISTLGDESLLIRRGSKIGGGSGGAAATVPRTLWKEHEKQEEAEDYGNQTTPPQKQQDKKNKKPPKTVKKSNKTTKKSSSSGSANKKKPIHRKKSKSQSPSLHQSKPDEVMEIKMDKSKSRSGNTLLMGLFSKTYSSSHDEDAAAAGEDPNEITPKSVDIYTTVGDPEEPQFEFHDNASVDSRRSISPLQKNKWRIIQFTVCLAIFLLAVAAVALTFSFLHAQENDTPLFENVFGKSETAEPQAPSQSDPFPPAFAPLVATNSPTIMVVTDDPQGPLPSTDAPTTDPLADVKIDLLSIIAKHSPNSLMEMESVVYESTDETTATAMATTSPQSLAYEWVLNDPYYWNYTEATKLQRWVLAVFYYSTDGNHWKTENFPPTFQLGKAPWLNYSSECLWESTNKGSNGDICNEPILNTEDNTTADIRFPHADLFALHLRTVGLNGTIPTELSLLMSLKIIFANGNPGLTGTLPTELGRLTQMEKLQLSNNSVEGSLPTEIGSWTRLTVAGFGNNALQGTLPTELGLWTNIVALGVQGNALNGTLPTEYGQLGRLENLAMERNRLSGTIPWQWQYMESLVSFSIQSNLVTGNMPEDMCYLRNLDDLIADCNSAVDCWCCSECF